MSSFLATRFQDGAGRFYIGEKIRNKKGEPIYVTRFPYRKEYRKEKEKCRTLSLTFFFALDVLLDRVPRLFGEIVLDLAGVFLGGLRIDPETLERVR
jgi:hypothetical protein